MEESKIKKYFSNKIGIVFDMMMGLLPIAWVKAFSLLSSTLDSLPSDTPAWMLNVLQYWLVIGWVAVITGINLYVLSRIKEISLVKENEHKEKAICQIQSHIAISLISLVSITVLLDSFLKLDKIAIDTPVWLINVAYSIVVILSIVFIILIIWYVVSAIRYKRRKTNQNTIIN